MAFVVLTPADVLAAPPGGPGAPSSPGSSIAVEGAPGAIQTTGFPCLVDGAVTAVRTAASVVPDPVLGGAATPLLTTPAIATTPPSLPSGMVGITATGPTSGSMSTPALAFAAGFAGATELYEIPNTTTDGPAPAGSPGAYDSSQSAPLGVLPVGAVTVAGATHTGVGLPYAQVFPILDGLPDFSAPLIPGGIPTTVLYQSYQTNPLAWMPGGSQPPSSCGAGHEYAVLTFATAPYVGRELAAGEPYAAYLLVRNTAAAGPLSNHIWYFQAAMASRPRPALAVAVTNDAAGGGVYRQSETAPLAGASVPFSVTVSDTSSVGETISAVTEAQAGTETPVCQGVVGQILRPGGSTRCYFTLSGYSAPAGETRTATVTVGVGETGLSSNSLSVQGTSSVTTAAAAASPSLAVLVDTTNDAAGTGYGQIEEAQVASSSVPFEVMIKNSSQVTEQISSVSVRYGEVSEPVCAPDVGQDLPALGSITCRFVLSGYAPPAGQSREATVTASVVAPGDRADSTQGSGSSTVTTGPATVALAVSVALTNDAAGGGSFLQSEIAPRAGEAVPFRLAISNGGSAAEEITAISDRFGATTLTECPALLGQSLDAGQTIYCDFTVSGFSPPAGESRIDTAAVQVSEPGNAADTQSTSGSSTVTTAASALLVTATVSAQTALAGQVLTYTIRVTNRGSAPAQNVQIKDVLSGTAGFIVDDGTDGTTDSFAGRPVEPVTKTAIGKYQWSYPALAPHGGTAVVVYRATIWGPASASAISNGRVELMDTVTVVAASGCTGTSCTATVSTSMLVAGSVQGASTIPPETPATGATLPLVPAGMLTVVGLLLITAAEVIRPRLAARKPASQGPHHLSALGWPEPIGLGCDDVRLSRVGWRWPGLAAQGIWKRGVHRDHVRARLPAVPAPGTWSSTASRHHLYRSGSDPPRRGFPKRSEVGAACRMLEWVGSAIEKSASRFLGEAPRVRSVN